MTRSADLEEAVKYPSTTVWNAHVSQLTSISTAGQDQMAIELALFSSECGLIVILGTRMAIRQVGFNHRAFGRAAKQIMVDVDQFEMQKANAHG